MKVVLCSLVPHYSHTALALQRTGHLKRYVTGFILTDPTLKNFTNIFPWKIQQKLLGSGRYNKNLNSDLITSLWYVELFRKILASVPITKGYYEKLISNTLFSLASSFYLDKCDILHFVSSQGAFSLRKAKKNGAIIIVDERGAHPTHRKKLLQEEHLRFGHSIVTEEFFENIRNHEYELADFIFVPSYYASKTFVEMGIDENKLFAIPYGVDTNTFVQIPKADKVFRVLYVGRISLGKGVHYLLQAWDQLKLKNSQLVLIGMVEETFRHIFKKFSGIFEHLPSVPHKELYEFYSNSSVFVLPSLSEGFGLVTYEAMACGLPVILTKNCGAVVRDEKDGFVIPIRDVDALKEKIFLFYESENLRKQMGNSAKTYVKNYTWERYGERVIQAYKNILAVKERPS